MRAVPGCWHSPNLKTEVVKKSKQQVNPALRLPAGRYKQLHVLNFVLEISRFKRENGNSKTSSCREKI
jgi:hypothetical protein